MKFFVIDTTIDNEYKLYDIKSGDVFFILKEKIDENWETPKYFTIQSLKYETIKEELKEWLIQVIKNNTKMFLEDISFSYDKVIKPMFRDSKLKQLGIT